ncbi:MAG: undecaprenyl-diphosphate phosphatase [Clostridia bacterium]|nr:undecaprenyl-diphosphate phosphatase [Clostridia bacterium]
MPFWAIHKKEVMYIMGFWDAIIQGIVQGLTEFLPVSSSGHVSLVQHFTGTNIEGAQSFTLFLHFGTLIAVFIVYWNKIWSLVKEFFSMVKDFFTGKFVWKLEKMNENRRMVIMIVIASACILVAFLPIFGIFGIYDSNGELVKSLKDMSGLTSEDIDIIVEGVCLLLTGTLLLYSTKLAKDRKKNGNEGKGEVTLKSAVAMGVGQAFATMPGLSRSGTTTTLGMITGTEKNAALEFSFIMGIPAILAANVLEVFEMDGAEVAQLNIGVVILGVVVAAVVGVLSIAGLKWIVSNDKLNYFGWYCLVVGTIVIIVGIIEMITNKQFTVFGAVASATGSASGSASGSALMA